MAQDQIAKLMAVAGKSGAAAADPPEVPEIPSGATALSSTPPPLTALPVSLPSGPEGAEIASPEAQRRVARRRPAGPVRSKIAANDDVPSIGGLIYSLEQKPSGKVFRIAAVASALWALVGLGFGVFTLAPEWANGASFGALLLKPEMFYTVACVVVPIAIFWLLALLNWHIASLALRSSTMTEVAIRLAEPDRAAEQSIASLGQAVRRQVSFMNDAVSRALGRAGELEALVHNQVADLERSYEQNERRIRGLINELMGERHALLNTSTGVTDTLKSLGTEIPKLIEKLSTQQATLATIIQGAGENLTALETSLSSATGRLENSLGTRTQQLQTVLEDYTTAFSTALGVRTEQMRTAFDTYMQTLDTSLGNRTENLQTVFEEYARALDTTLANRAQALDVQLVERTRSLDDAFQKRLQSFDDQILRSTAAIDSAVSEKAQLLTTALDAHATTFRESVSRQAVELDEAVVNGINSVRRTSENITRQSLKAIEGLASQSDMLKNVSENLLAQINGVTGRFENQGQQILKAAGTLEAANYKIDSTLQMRQSELAHTLDRLSGKADDFGRMIHGYSSNLEGTLASIEDRTRSLTEELASGTHTRSRAMLEDLERLKRQTEAESESALNSLKARFSSVTGELGQEFDSLSSRLALATDEARTRAAEAAQTLAREQARLQEEASRLPAAARDSADAMRRALQDQLKALDQLSALSARTASARDITAPDLPVPPAPVTRQVPTFSSALPTSSASKTPAPPALQESGREGWSLGDLLARASREEEAQAAAQLPQPQVQIQAQPQPLPPPPQQAQPFRLDIGVISRAIDPATASAVWNRLRAGQRNAMVRSIYTPDARNVFDEVQRRITLDGDLRQTVMRYLSDFERIIKDADARDPGGRLTQSHLVSDTGRVYLFLAHAAGRLP